MTENAGQAPPWPNQQEPLDGVVPTAEVSQDPDLFADDTDLTAAMED